ncbi:MAG: hypothetical protein QW569_01400, partial [Candidatus Bathyarchaeia archaeon]
PRLGAKLTGVIGFLHAWDWMSRKHPQLEVRAMLVVLGPIDAECRGLLAEMFSPRPSSDSYGARIAWRDGLGSCEGDSR